MKQKMVEKCYVNGSWITSRSKIKVINPFDLKEIGSIPNLTKTQVTSAIKAADKAFESWKNLSAYERASYLLKLIDTIEKHKQEFSRIITLESGKPIKEALTEIDYGNAYLRWFAEEAVRVYGDVIPSNKVDEHIVVLKQPIGVVATITPWNFPYAMITRKCAPALAAGCTVVIRPSSKTPFSATFFAKLCELSKIPKGVVNVVTGPGMEMGTLLSTHPLIKKLSFTGSTEIGKKLMAKCASTVKKISFELGGNAPAIIFDDADLSSAIKHIIAAKFRNSGQTCICANRIFIHEDIYEKALKLLISEVKKLKVGNGLNKNTSIGPLISKEGLEKAERLVKDACKKGAKVAIGAKMHKTFYYPTILTNVSNQMAIYHTEIFAPIMPIITFKTEKQVIALANDTPYGLASYFFSKDISRVWRVAEELNYGIIGINEGIVSKASVPFGGLKQSGMGREGSKYGIQDYLEIKYLCMGKIN